MNKYKHNEAYCLMIYKCEFCKTIEIVWNSRDGVTPFSIECRQCKNFMNHNYWELDERNENYNPFIGQKIFIDGKKVKNPIDGTMISYPKTIIYEGNMIFRL